MKQIAKILLVVISLNGNSFAQIKGDIQLSYIFPINAVISENDDLIASFIGGLDFEKRITKKQFSPFSIHARMGVQYVRTGYSLYGYVEERQDFYIENSLSYDIKSSFFQNFFTVPIGLEFRLNEMPVLSPIMSTVSIKLLITNSILLKSRLSERVYNLELSEDLSQVIDLSKGLTRYVPGLLIQINIIRLINFGMMMQRINYKSTQQSTTFDGRGASPFYEIITRNGIYQDISVFIGFNIPLEKKHK